MRDPRAAAPGPPLTSKLSGKSRGRVRLTVAWTGTGRVGVITGRPIMADGNFYFCLTHETVEEGAGCRGADRMGPYPTGAAAANWQSAHAAREDAWKAADEADEA